MATNSVQGKWDQVEKEEEVEEEEEALSLCDLPVNFINNEDQPSKADSQVIENQEEFDFRSWGGLISKESEMCAADEVFFQGQILPLRLSFSSEAGLITPGFQRDDQQFNRCKSRSESLDHGSLSEFRSNSSRSSSLRSQTSSLSSSTSSTTTTTPRISKPRVRNQFHTHPSPKPQLRVTVPRQASFGNQSRKSSSTWEFFRLGVVPAPEIGLQDLKVRSTISANKNSVSRNSSSSSSNSTSNPNSTMKSVKMSNKTHHNDKSNHVFKQFIGKGGGLLSGCKCSIETVQSDIVIIKGDTKSTNKTESTTHAMKEKVLELKKQKHRQKQGKKVMSRHRTFEWLKELHASHPDEDALLSNS